MNQEPRKAFVLLVVIVTLVIAATALVRVSQTTLDNVQRGLARAEGLQLKWGRITLSNVALPSAAELFDNLESLQRAQTREQRQEPLTRLRERIVLGGQTFDLVLSDEDAKLNAHGLSELHGTESAANAISNVLPPKYHRCLRMSARGSDLKTWGDLIDLIQLRKMHGDDRALAEISANLTLWGPARINIHRASPDVLAAQCATVVPRGTAQRIVESLSESSTDTEVELLIRGTVKNPGDQLKLRRLLSDGSTTFGLWIETTNSKMERSQEFVVRSIDENGLPISQRFVLK